MNIADAIFAAFNRDWIAADLVEQARSYNWERTASGLMRVFRSALRSRELPEGFDRSASCAVKQQGEQT